MAATAVATVFLCAGSAQAGALDDTLTISPPANVTVPATMPCGQDYCAQVYFSFTASGGTPPYNFVCGAPPGSLFTVGQHNVGCLAQDWRGNSTPIATFTITVTAFAADTTPPVFQDVPPISAVADSSGQAVLSYPLPTATDNIDGPVPVHCDPWHGGPDGFSLGTTTATCTATDSRGNTATTTFTITVTAPSTPTPGGTTPPATTPPASTTTPPATSPTAPTTTGPPTTAPPVTTTVTQTATQPPAPASPPVADFSAASANPNVVTFTDTSKAGSAPISTHTWQFGDGSAASGAHPTHAYRGPGSYTVTEITVDANGLTSVAVHDLTIAANHAISLGPRQTQAKKKPAVKHAPAKHPKAHRTKP